MIALNINSPKASPPHFNMSIFKIDIKNKNDIIICDVVFVGRKNSREVKMVLDTGANITTISKDVALGIGCDPINSKRRMEFITANGIAYAPIITIPKLKVFSFTLENVDLICHDLPSRSPVLGLLGLSVLKKFNISLRFLDNIIEINRQKDN